MSGGRDPPCSPNEHNKYAGKCVICSTAKHIGVYEQFRISKVDRAKDFLNAILVLLDEVYTRTCGLEDAEAVFEADFVLS